MPEEFARREALGSEEEPGGMLFVLFIPSKDKNGGALPRGQDQQLWADAANDLLATLFGEATIMPPARGKWLNEETNTVIAEEVVLVHSYARARDAASEEKLVELAKFLHRMGKKTRQGEVAVVIDGVFHRIRKFRLS